MSLQVDFDIVLGLATKMIFSLHKKYPGALLRLVFDSSRCSTRFSKIYVIL
jgi:hypothetical protein